MTYHHSIQDPTLFAGLTALAESAFPKRCNTCGRIYPNAESYLFETQHLPHGHSGLKASTDDDGAPILEVFRNCACGSTLLDFFNERRDLSKAGVLRRQRFGDLLGYLEKRGINPATAREELIKVLHGEDSPVLAALPAADKP